MNTWGDLITTIQKTTKQPTTGLGKWDSTELMFRANIIQSAVASEVLCLTATEVINATQGTLNYTPTNNWLAARSVRYEGIPLVQTTEAKIAHMIHVGGIQARSRKDAGKPKFWYLVGDDIHLFPLAVEDNKGAIEVDQWVRATEFADTSTTCWNGVNYMESFTDIIIFGVIAWCLGEVNESKGEVSFWWQWFNRRTVSLSNLISQRFGIPVPADPTKIGMSGLQKSIELGHPTQPQGVQ